MNTSRWLRVLGRKGMNGALYLIVPGVSRYHQSVKGGPILPGGRAGAQAARHSKCKCGMCMYAMHDVPCSEPWRGHAVTLCTDEGQPCRALCSTQHACRCLQVAICMMVCAWRTVQRPMQHAQPKALPQVEEDDELVHERQPWELRHGGSSAARLRGDGSCRGKLAGARAAAAGQASARKCTLPPTMLRPLLLRPQFYRDVGCHCCHCLLPLVHLYVHVVVARRRGDAPL
eukprot:1185409-Prymnesium_polylepis.1